MLLRIKNLKITASVGVHEWEKRTLQEVVLNVALTIDAAKATASDALADTADYDAIEARLIEAVRARHYELLEAMVAAVGEAALSFAPVTSAEVEIDKPGALKHSESVSLSERFAR